MVPSPPWEHMAALMSSNTLIPWFGATVWKHFTGCHLAAAALGTPVLTKLTPGPVPAPTPPIPRPPSHPLSCCLPPWSASVGGRPITSHDGSRGSCRASAWTVGSQTLREFWRVLQGTGFFFSSLKRVFKQLGVRHRPAARAAREPPCAAMTVMEMNTGVCDVKRRLGNFRGERVNVVRRDRKLL